MYDRFTLAREYETWRRRVLATQRGTPTHTVRLHALANCAADLHAAERAAGVPMGSTREAMA